MPPTVSFSEADTHLVGPDGVTLKLHLGHVANLYSKGPELRASQGGRTHVSCPKVTFSQTSVPKLWSPEHVSSLQNSPWSNTFGTFWVRWNQADSTETLCVLHLQEGFEDAGVCKLTFPGNTCWIPGHLFSMEPALRNANLG